MAKTIKRRKDAHRAGTNRKRSGMRRPNTQSRKGY